MQSIQRRSKVPAAVVTDMWKWTHQINKRIHWEDWSNIPIPIQTAIALVLPSCLLLLLLLLPHPNTHTRAHSTPLPHRPYPPTALHKWRPPCPSCSHGPEASPPAGQTSPWHSGVLTEVFWGDNTGLGEEGTAGGKEEWGGECGVQGRLSLKQERVEHEITRKEERIV